MAPRSDSEFSTDGLKTDLIPLIEWFQRSLEELSLTSTEAADFASLMERGTLSINPASTHKRTLPNPPRNALAL